MFENSQLPYTHSWNCSEAPITGLQTAADTPVVPVHRLSHDQYSTLDQTVNLSKW
jgi:hypothetical protein